MYMRFVPGANHRQSTAELAAKYRVCSSLSGTQEGLTDADALVSQAINAVCGYLCAVQSISHAHMSQVSNAVCSPTFAV